MSNIVLVFTDIPKNYQYNED